MSEPVETISQGKRRGGGGGLSGKLLPELKQIASGLGIKGAGTMKKAQLVEAIRSAQSGTSSTTQSTAPSTAQPAPQPEATSPTQSAGGSDRSDQQQPAAQAQRAESSAEQPQADPGEPGGQQRQQAPRQQRQRQQADRQTDRQPADRHQTDRQQTERQQTERPEERAGGQPDQRDDDDGGQSRRSRRRRGRERGPRERRPQDVELEVTEDDVLVPVAGIVDILENYAFVRTSGYLPGSSDVYVSLSMVRRYGLRKGDAVTGAVKLQREGESRQKFNPLVRLESINGSDPDAVKERVEFGDLTPLHSSDRLRLETGPDDMAGRVIDIVAPLGKGQRGLVVAPPQAGRTTILQSIAKAITANNPECHLMIVLIDERPEEVTEFQQTVKGEVIASTFDRPPSDHTSVAELALERAKRLVELGHDVVILLDGITRLGRAYNLAAPAGGRVLAGEVDAGAIHPTKRFFGAARNIEDGGSLTIVATAQADTGSRTDEVFLEEFAGTGNTELRLRRELADKGLFPAVDALRSGTRREELLMSAEELAIVRRLRETLAELGAEAGLESLLERLRRSQSNIEFLMQVQRTPSKNGGA